MHIQVVNFHLKGMTEQQFADQCDQLAPAFASVAGLVHKVWLADPASGTFGGVYTWEDRQAMERYLASDLFKGVASHPNLTDITSKDFGVLEGPTRVTRGLVAAHA